MQGFLIFFLRMLDFVIKQPVSESETNCTEIGCEDEGLITAAESLVKDRHPLWPYDRWQALHQNRPAASNFSLATLTGFFVEQKVSSDKHITNSSIRWL